MYIRYSGEKTKTTFLKNISTYCDVYIYIYIHIYIYMYVIMKTMSPPRYHHNGFVATHALGHMNCTSCAQVQSCHKAIER